MNEYLFMALVAEGVAAIGQVFLKKSAQKTIDRNQTIGKFVNFNVILGYILFLASTFLNLLAYKQISLKFMPALSSLSFIYILLFSLLIFKERLRKKQIIGMIIIIIGIVISCI